MPTTKTVTETLRRVRYTVRGVWHDGELVDAGCTWRIVRADDSGHRMLLPASDVREGMVETDAKGGTEAETD